jgi:hypothetical protein
MSASASDRAYFQRIGARNRYLSSGSPAAAPSSLREAFERLAALEAALGGLAAPGRAEGDGDWPSHLSFLQHLKSRGHDNDA